MRVAVIGSGIAGLASAWLLSRRHEVTLYEANHYLGGHTHTHDIVLGGRIYAVDTGFIVHNPAHYPLLTRLFDELGVVSQPTTMSFAVHNEASGLEYNTTSLDALFCQRRNLFSPRFLGMVRDLLRFYREAPTLLDGAEVGPTLGEYLFERGYGATPDAVAENVRRLAATGAAGLNLEDSVSDSRMRDLAEQVDRIRAAHAAAPELWINARVDALRRGESVERMLERANAYLEAGGGSAFVLGLDTPELVRRAVDGISGPVAVIARYGGIPLAQLADLGVARVSFGPGPHSLAMTSLARAAQTLTARGDYPPELTF